MYPTHSASRRGFLGISVFWAVAVPALLAPAWPAAAQVQDALVGHWKLDDNGPTNLVADASPNQFHGTLDAATAERSVTGRLGRAIRFPAKGGVRLDRHAEALGKLSDFTISLWIQYDGGASRQLFTFSDGTLYHRVQVEVHNDRLHFGWQDGGDFAGFGTDSLSWTPGVWYHVVFVNDSRAGKSILRTNDLAWKTDVNTVSPATLHAAVQRIEIGSLNGEYPFHGCLADVRLFRRALPLAEQLALYEASPDPPPDPQWDSAKSAMLERHHRAERARQARERFFTDEAPHLSRTELQQKTDWLFQAEGDDLQTRTDKEIGWTRQLIQRLQEQHPTLDLADELAAVTQIEQRVADGATALAASATRQLYFDIRALKRRVLFRSPAVNFTDILCVDAPYPHRSPDTHGTFDQAEWVHESRFRSEMCATPGAKLLVLQDIGNVPRPLKLAPPDDFGCPVAMLGFDLSFAGDRAVFCMKPADERAYHLYEIGLDGGAASFRQLTRGGYSDIDPLYLPDGRYLFLSTRADVYAQCGMWARSYILTRCDPDGSHVRILTPGTEPEFSPSLLDDGRILFTRWEYVDKFANRIQSLWTIRPDGTAAAACWGNQSVQPDHLGEARQIPGTGKILFSGFGHHDVWAGCLGIVAPQAGLNFPHGLWKVTQERPWPEVGDGPLPTPGAADDYHTSGPYAAYKTPYPLSEQLFLVSARTGDLGGGFMHSAHDPALGKFKLYLMDVYGNRELLFEGDQNVLYAQPVRPRKSPPVLPEAADLPGTEGDRPTVRSGVFYSNNIFDHAPAEIRQHGRYLRVVESLPKNYSVGIVHSGGKPFGSAGPNTAWGVWGETFLPGRTPTPTTDVSWGDQTQFCGPATTLTGPLGVKQVHGTVPIRPDGSVCFEVPPCRMLYFQVLDQHHRAVHTMRSWVSVRPGEYRGCTGCHEGHQTAPAGQALAAGTVPAPLQAPPWGVRSLSYVQDIQPIFDRACAECHQADGVVVDTLDLTLRPDPVGETRWGGIFPEPYLTLLLGRNHQRLGGACPGFDGAGGYVAVPNTIATRYDTLPPLTYLSPKSRLIDKALDQRCCGRQLTSADLQLLIAWVDLWAMYRSDEELRQIEDPPAEWFPLWTCPPKMKSAPRVRTEYRQDEYRCPEDRLVIGAE